MFRTSDCQLTDVGSHNKRMFEEHSRSTTHFTFKVQFFLQISTQSKTLVTFLLRLLKRHLFAKHASTDDDR